MKRSPLLSLVLFFSAISFVPGCNPLPRERIIREAITAYFEEPLQGRGDEYGRNILYHHGPEEGYVVPIRSITLEATMDKGEPSASGKGIASYSETG